MCKTTRRDMYRAAALQGLLAYGDPDRTYQECIDNAIYIGDLMESRARAEDAERYDTPKKSEATVTVKRTCGTCQRMSPITLTCRYDGRDDACHDYSRWQPREPKEADDALPTA